MSNINLGIWEDFNNQIKGHLAGDNINNFMNWPIINQTMIAGVDLVEFDYLKKSKYWDKWSTKLDESVFKPNSFRLFPASSTNNMHHAYSLNVMMEYLNLELNQFGTVVEFGGGYGNTCRLFKKWGHNGQYIIYDIPELIKIQKHYLESNKITNNVTFLSGLDIINNFKDNSLFLGLWSISETPIFERNRMLDNLKFYDCENIFIAMGGSFFGENNITWINEEIIPNLNNLGYEHKLHRIEHGNEMYYFMAKKIK
jgi:hypothetical protein